MLNTFLTLGAFNSIRERLPKLEEELNSLCNGETENPDEALYNAYALKAKAAELIKYLERA